jgi:hypothetical protein
MDREDDAPDRGGHNQYRGERHPLSIRAIPARISARFVATIDRRSTRNEEKEERS